MKRKFEAAIEGHGEVAPEALIHSYTSQKYGDVRMSKINRRDFVRLSGGVLS